MHRPLHLLLSIIDLQGGAGVFLRNLAMGLKQAFGEEFNITLLLCRDGGRLAGDERWFDRVRVLSFQIRRGLATPGDLARQVAQLRTAVRELAPDVIVSAGTYANIMMPLAAPARTSCVATVHTNLTHQLAGSSARFAIKPLLAWSYSRQTVVAPSAGVAADLASLGMERAVVIPHGIDIDRVRDLATGAPASPLPSGRYAIAVGRLTGQKDYPTLLHAFAQAVANEASLDLAIVGDGPDRAALENLTRQLNLSQRIHFLGHQDNPFPYMARAECFVLSSIWEGFGLVLIEAMALGLPCISTDCPSGPSEILDRGRHGLLVPIRDPQALADAIGQVARSPDLQRELSRRSLRRAEDFTLRQMAARYRDLLRGLVLDR